MGDDDLIRRAADGDAAAFAALVGEHRERVFWIAYHVVGDAELARDVAQDVFLRLFRVLSRFREGGRFAAWLYRITLNLAIDALRRERPHREAAAIEDPDRLAASPGGAALRQAEVRRIFAVISARLGRKQRSAFILREIEGLSTEEVAEVLKTRPSTVRNHILQARRILKTELLRRFPEYCRRMPGGKD